MKTKQSDFPLLIKISFSKLFEKYETFLGSKNELYQQRAEDVLKLAEEYPLLSEGLVDENEVENHKEVIDLVLEDTFTSLLEENEIKIATIPYQYFIFKSSKRYKELIKTAGKDYQIKLTDFDADQAYIMGCAMILNGYYGYKVDFRRPFYYNIPDKQGIMRYYKMLYNADFTTIEKTDKSIDITAEDVSELIENFDNIDLWRKKFPPQSWLFKGFVIANMYDATTDVSLSNFKANLLKDDGKDETFVEDFESIIRAIFNLADLKVGYTFFNEEDEQLEQLPFLSSTRSYILDGRNKSTRESSLCKSSMATLFDKHEFYCVSNVKKYHKLYPENALYKTLTKQKVQSAILTPLVLDGKVQAVMEIVSPNAQDLNTINANKLHDIMPFLIDSVRRSKEKEENQIELLIQSECTSIHPSVYWKFKKAAKKVIKGQLVGNQVAFKEVVFDDIYPLYGQIDIKGSSEARNVATQKDLILQLKLVKRIINSIYKIESLPIYEQIDFRIEKFLVGLKQNILVDSERKILRFLGTEIIPLYEHLSNKNDDLKALIDEYYELVDDDKGFIYKHRKDYDDSVMVINKRMAGILDTKQDAAQQMYPHFFERFKTDGVEHSLYIGESITKGKSFNKIYLYNLRLWKLQVMCEMENDFYKLKKTLPMPLDVASMILVFGGSLSLRFRMDEKRFDVDGTYNARYEVVKKRVDKAKIKGTKERITQSGKIAIIYSQKEDEIEFLKYIEFLQSKKQLDEAIEILELEDLQGVTGLKAIRVSVLYSKEQDDSKEYYTYEDLMDEIDR